MVILDVSAAVTWFFVDERDEESVAMANAVAEHGAVVPPLFRWEMQNAFLMAFRRKRVSIEDADVSLGKLDGLHLEVDQAVLAAPLARGLTIAQRFNLTAYDAAYLELATRRSLPLMTRDKRLGAAAQELDILWKPQS